VGLTNRYTDAVDKQITDQLKEKLPLLSQPGPAAALANMNPGLKDTLNNVTATTMEDIKSLDAMELQQFLETVNFRNSWWKVSVNMLTQRLVQLLCDDTSAQPALQALDLEDVQSLAIARDLSAFRSVDSVSQLLGATGSHASMLRYLASEESCLPCSNRTTSFAALSDDDPTGDDSPSLPSSSPPPPPAAAARLPSLQEYLDLSRYAYQDPAGTGSAGKEPLKPPQGFEVSDPTGAKTLLASFQSTGTTGSSSSSIGGVKRYASCIAPDAQRVMDLMRTIKEPVIMTRLNSTGRTG